MFDNFATAATGSSGSWGKVLKTAKLRPIIITAARLDADFALCLIKAPTCADSLTQVVLHLEYANSPKLRIVGPVKKRETRGCGLSDKPEERETQNNGCSNDNANCLAPGARLSVTGASEPPASR